ncbi:formylglycine-generating enzyme family protein [Leisingera daeponensis]|uniref:formylglycine-generating enzyme family protein n=1 Tax=Leisingera daeponensis TaxID=405746 RepID=UPI0021BD83FF|nr:formylglycine-generating enzyme family protein [Leisingera daeponensis]
MRRKALTGMGLGAAAAVVAGFYLLQPDPGAPLRTRGPATVEIPGGEVSFRPIGNFQRAGKTVSAPYRTEAVAPFHIMVHQVTRAEYQACVAAGGCAPVGAKGGGSLPQTHVSWVDAHAYAVWLAAGTGQAWRLPTAQEWQMAAAERFGDALPERTGLDPGQRMLLQYAQGTLLRGRVRYGLQSAGSYGLNSMGVADLSRGVWEWTDSCMENATLLPDGRLAEVDHYCGARIAGGVHRAAVIDFVRDASVGGCAVGLPPDYLGFRLVRPAGPEW